MKTVMCKTWEELTKEVKRGNFEHSYRPETWEDLCQVGPRSYPCMGEPAGSDAADFTMQEFVPVFNKELCTKCGTCYVFCHLGLIYEEEDGYFNSRTEYCRSCGVCAYECKSGAIEMVRKYK
jgi:2-oxoacid:acceptor oxidoreductase delta subunit (pyruvate/2-ketoisovalerate family)